MPGLGDVACRSSGVPGGQGLDFDYSRGSAEEPMQLPRHDLRPPETTDKARPPSSMTVVPFDFSRSLQRIALCEGIQADRQKTKTQSESPLNPES